MPKFHVGYVVGDYFVEDAIDVEASDRDDAAGKALTKIIRDGGYWPEEVTITRVDRAAEKGVSHANL